MLAFISDLWRLLSIFYDIVCRRATPPAAPMCVSNPDVILRELLPLLAFVTRSVSFVDSFEDLHRDLLGKNDTGLLLHSSSYLKKPLKPFLMCNQ